MVCGEDLNLLASRQQVNAQTCHVTVVDLTVVLTNPSCRIYSVLLKPLFETLL